MYLTRSQFRQVTRMELNHIKILNQRNLLPFRVLKPGESDRNKRYHHLGALLTMIQTNLTADGVIDLSHARELALAFRIVAKEEHISPQDLLNGKIWFVSLMIAGNTVESSLANQYLGRTMVVGEIADCVRSIKEQSRIEGNSATVRSMMFNPCPVYKTLIARAKAIGIEISDDKRWNG